MPIYHSYYPRTYTSRILHNTTYILSGIDHASNFFVYVIRGEKFREILFDRIPCFRIICGKQPKTRNEISSITSINVVNWSLVLMGRVISKYILEVKLSEKRGSHLFARGNVQSEALNQSIKYSYTNQWHWFWVSIDLVFIAGAILTLCI